MRIRGYAAGTPCWAELVSPDPAAARAFYAGLFRWTFDDEGHLALDGRAVAGMRAQPGAPAQWLISISTDDSAATARAVTAACGQVRQPPVAVRELGTAASFTDTDGAIFATWQRGRFIGTQVTFEPGAICWYELATHDIGRAERFYRDVFGWHVLEAASMPGDAYYEFHHYGNTVAGLVPIDHRFPPSMTDPHWTVCFLVDDCVSACERVVELGGTVARKPTNVSVGWYARVADPSGAHFALIELSDEYPV